MTHWQDIVAGALIATAVVYLARVFWCRLVKRASSCDPCPGCLSSLGRKAQRDGSDPLRIQASSQNTGDE